MFRSIQRTHPSSFPRQLSNFHPFPASSHIHLKWWHMVGPLVLSHPKNVHVLRFFSYCVFFQTMLPITSTKLGLQKFRPKHPPVKRPKWEISPQAVGSLSHLFKALLASEWIKFLHFFGKDFPFNWSLAKSNPSRFFGLNQKLLMLLYHS